MRNTYRIFVITDFRKNPLGTPGCGRIILKCILEKKDTKM
jgi:hypothetical protein